MKSVVTGAARGLGEGIAARLVSDGGHVALIDVDEDVSATAERLQAEHPGSLALAVRCDVADEARVASAVDKVVARLGGIDLLVNNAGIGGPSTTVVDTSLEEFRHVLDVNLTGTFLMARACASVTGLPEIGPSSIVRSCLANSAETARLASGAMVLMST